MKLTHHAIPLIAEITKFEKVDSLSHLVEHTDNIANKNGSSDYPTKSIKGDIFEIFVEFFVNKLGLHNDISLSNYKVSSGSNDYGVDASGIAGDGEPAAIQVKYRHNPKDLITYEESAKFFMQATTEFKVDLNNMKNLLFITTAYGFNQHAQKQAGDKGMRILGRNDIENIIGITNKAFWNEFRKVFNNSTDRKDRVQLTRMDHQNEAKLAFDRFTGERAQIIMPTGSGKTMVEHDLVNDTIMKGGLISLVCAPRIALVDNLLKNFWEFKNEDWIYRVFSSGGKEQLEAFSGDAIRNAAPTTSQKDIELEINNAIETKTPLVLFSTYHSVHKIGKVLNRLGLKADILIADEAHNLTRTDWNKYLQDDRVPFKKMISFTATRRVALKEKDIGMNNRELFGDVIYKVDPQVMIEKGCIVPPRVMFIRLTDNKDDLEASVVENAIRYFKENIRKDRDCRIIISCTSADEAHNMADSEQLQAKLKEFSINAVTSLTHRMGGKTRNEIFEEYGSSENAIIFHYDIISEGIDLPGTTAVMPMRLLPPIKATQTIGRALRITKEDREKLRKEEIKVGNSEGWDKPFGYVIVYEKDGDVETSIASDQLEEIVFNLRKDGYDADVEINQIVDESEGGMNQDVDPYSRKQKLVRLEDIENRVIKRIEEEEKAFAPISIRCTKSMKEIKESLTPDILELLQGTE